MLPNRSLWVPPTSGFVPLGSAGTLDDDVLEARARPTVARRPLVEQGATTTSPVRERAAAIASRVQPWQPPTTLLVRRVEMAVLAAVCAYFSIGLVKVLGLL